jgi:hypothetical protein
VTRPLGSEGGVTQRCIMPTDHLPGGDGEASGWRGRDAVSPARGGKFIGANISASPQWPGVAVDVSGYDGKGWSFVNGLRGS